MAKFFTEHGLPGAYAGSSIVSAKRRRTEYWPAKEWRLLYELEVDVPRLPPLLAIATLDDPADGSASMRGEAVLPGPPRVAEFFPDDKRLLHLAAASDAAQVGQRLGGMSLAERVTDVEVLRYRPHTQCVFRYTVEPPSGGTTRVGTTRVGTTRVGTTRLIGKVYSSREAAASAWDKLQSLANGSAGGEVSFPEPVGLVEDWNLVLMAEVPGTSVNALLKATSGEAGAETVVRRVAVGLAGLHALPSTGEEGKSLSSTLELVDRRAALARAIAPELAGQLDGLLEAIRSLELAPCESDVLAHGEFGPSHLFLEGEDLALVDLDTLASGDPALDVGNFMAVLVRNAALKGRTHLGVLAERFSAEYQARSSQSELARRARAFQSLALVRMVVERLEQQPHLYAKKGLAWPPLVLLDEAATVLRDL